MEAEVQELRRARDGLEDARALLVGPDELRETQGERRALRERRDVPRVRVRERAHRPRLQVEDADHVLVEHERHDDLGPRLRPADDVVRVPRHVRNVHDASRPRREGDQPRGVERDHGDRVARRPPVAAAPVLHEGAPVRLDEKQAARLVAEVSRERVEDLGQEDVAVRRARQEGARGVREAARLAHGLGDRFRRAALLEGDADEVRERLERLDVVELDAPRLVARRDRHDADRLARRAHREDPEGARARPDEPFPRRALRLEADVREDHRLTALEHPERVRRALGREGLAAGEVVPAGSAVPAERRDGVTLRGEERERRDRVKERVPEARERRVDDVPHRRRALDGRREVEQDRQPVALAAELVDELRLLERRREVVDRRLEKRDVLGGPLVPAAHRRGADEPAQDAVDPDRDEQHRRDPVAAEGVVLVGELGLGEDVRRDDGLEAAERGGIFGTTPGGTSVESVGAPSAAHAARATSDAGPASLPKRKRVRRSTARIRPICETDQFRNSWSWTPSTSASANSERKRSRTPPSAAAEASRLMGADYPPARRRDAVPAPRASRGGRSQRAVRRGLKTR